MKESFLNFLTEKTGLTMHEISQRSGEGLENLFNEIESEYGMVSVDNIDPEYITMFNIK